MQVHEGKTPAQQFSHSLQDLRRLLARHGLSNWRGDSLQVAHMVTRGTACTEQRTAKDSTGSSTTGWRPSCGSSPSQAYMGITR